MEEKKCKTCRWFDPPTQSEKEAGFKVGICGYHWDKPVKETECCDQHKPKEPK